VREQIPSVLIVSLALTGCGQEQQAMLPELKGRWAAENGARVRAAVAAYESGTPTPTTIDRTLCRTGYVTFDKQRVTFHLDGKATPIYLVEEATRAGSRVTLKGKMPSGSKGSRIELLLRTDGIRLDDVIKEQGRSVRYARFENPTAREVGVKTIGDVFRMYFDLKPCPTGFLSTLGL
jgi:hypothetical protein